jgi:hypothetical protein
MLSRQESPQNTQIILDNYKNEVTDQNSDAEEVQHIEHFNEDLERAMQQNYAYPDPSDPELQYKNYVKREFYAHRIPPRPDINDYSDIKEYRDNVCARDFALHEHQAMLSNYINPDTPYKGLILFHGLGSGKCVKSDAQLVVNGILVRIEDVWYKYKSEKCIIDQDSGEWSDASTELIVNSIDSKGKIVKKKVKRLYREKINCQIKDIELENGYKSGITQVHRLLKHNGWSNSIMAGDYVAIPRKLYNCPEKNTLDVSDDLAFLLGKQASEGCWRNRSCIAVTSNDYKALDNMKHSIYRVGKKYKINLDEQNVKIINGKRPYLLVNSKNILHSSRKTVIQTLTLTLTKRYQILL